MLNSHLLKIRLTMLCIASLPLTARSEVRETPELNKEFVNRITAFVLDLDGRLTNVENHTGADNRAPTKTSKQIEATPEEQEIIKVIALEAGKNPDLMNVMGPLSDLTRKGGKGNQRQRFLTLLLQIACQGMQDGCELRRRVDAVERRLDSIAQSSPRSGPHSSFQGLGDTVSSRIAPEPDLAEPSSPSKRFWNGVPDRIVDRRELFCPHAQLLFEGVYRQFGNDLYYGDVYRNCNGQIIFFRHEQTGERATYR